MNFSNYVPPVNNPTGILASPNQAANSGQMASPNQAANLGQVAPPNRAALFNTGPISGQAFYNTGPSSAPAQLGGPGSIFQSHLNSA
jgi:hypothetical protein